MAIVSNTVSSRLRLVDDQNQFILALRNVDPSVNPIMLDNIIRGIVQIRPPQPAGSAFLVVTNELSEEI